MEVVPPTISSLALIGANIKAISLVGDYISRLPFLYGQEIRPDYSDSLFTVTDPDYYLDFIKDLGYNSVVIPIYLDLAFPLKSTEINNSYVTELEAAIKKVNEHGMNPIISFPQRHISRRLGGYGFPDWCLPDKVLSYFNVGEKGQSLATAVPSSQTTKDVSGGNRNENEKISEINEHPNPIEQNQPAPRSGAGSYDAGTYRHTDESHLTSREVRASHLEHRAPVSYETHHHYFDDAGTSGGEYMTHGRPSLHLHEYGQFSNVESGAELAWTISESNPGPSIERQLVKQTIHNYEGNAAGINRSDTWVENEMVASNETKQPSTLTSVQNNIVQPSNTTVAQSMNQDTKNKTMEKSRKNKSKNLFYNNPKYNNAIIDVLVPTRVTCNTIMASAELHKALKLPELYNEKKTKWSRLRGKKKGNKVEDIPCLQSTMEPVEYVPRASGEDLYIFPPSTKMTDTEFAKETAYRLDCLLTQLKNKETIQPRYGQFPAPMLGHKWPTKLTKLMGKLEAECLKHLEDNSEVLVALCGAVKMMCSRLKEHVIAICPPSCLGNLPIGDDGYTTEYESTSIVTQIQDVIASRFPRKPKPSVSNFHESLVSAAFDGSGNLKTHLKFKFSNFISPFAEREKGLTIEEGKTVAKPEMATTGSERILKHVTELSRPLIFTSLNSWEDDAKKTKRFLVHMSSIMLPSAVTVADFCAGVSLHSVVVNIHCDTGISISTCTPFMKKISGSPVGWMCGAASSSVLAGHAAKVSGYYDLRQSTMETSPKAASLEEVEAERNKNTNTNTAVAKGETGEEMPEHRVAANTVTKTKKDKEGKKVRTVEIPLTTLTVVTQYPNHHMATEMYHSGIVILTGTQSVGGLFAPNFAVEEEKKDKKIKKRKEKQSDSDDIPPPDETLAVLSFKSAAAASLEAMVLSNAALIQTYGQGVLNKMTINVIGSSEDNSVMKAISRTDGISGVFASSNSDVGVIASIHGDGIPIEMVRVGVKSVTVKDGKIHTGIMNEDVTGAVFYDCKMV